MTNDWKIKISLYHKDCDVMYDTGIMVEDMPIPRKGEIIWLSQEQEDKFNVLIENCRDRHRCSITKCPFYNYGGKITLVPDYIFVSDVRYELERKTVVVHISEYG